MLPIKLRGINQGQRRKLLNEFVNNTNISEVPFDSVKCLPEESPVDKLFKINLANKYRNLEYIVECLKDSDMLYISYALKCEWLIESHIINPIYLEQTLYPNMKTTGKNKMKHWIQHKLKDKQNCQTFYEFYKGNDFNYAVKYLTKCDSSFILVEMSKYASRITPSILKVLSEQTPLAADKYFKELLLTDEVIVSYLEKGPKDYIKAISIILKPTPDTYFYILETYFERKFKRLSRYLTKYIMKNHRNVFDKKPELYVGLILDIATVAKFMTPIDAKNIILKLARAEYLHQAFTFDYKTFEPIIKKIDRKERSKFCKKIFEEKDFGDSVKEASYQLPSNPKTSKLYNLNINLLQEFHSDSDYADDYPEARCMYSFRPMLKKRKMARYVVVTELDKMYDHYRFSSFDEVFAHLNKKITKESSSKIREYMILVLVSKTGGQEKSLNILIDMLATRHINEATNLRSTIIRSLVKRAQIWRSPPLMWASLMKFGHDLGLDGTSPVICREGLHAVVLYNFVNNQTLPKLLADSFINDFSNLTEYNLNVNERKQVLDNLTSLLLKLTEDNKEDTPKLLQLWLDTLCAYRVSSASTQWDSGVHILKQLAKTNIAAAKPLLKILYNHKIARKELLAENLRALPSNSMYLAAIKQNVSLVEEHVTQLKEDLRCSSHYRQFLRVLSIFWPELSDLIINELKPQPGYAVALLMLSGSLFNQMVTENLANNPQSKLLHNLYSNAHLVRPNIAIEEVIAQKKSQIAIANWIHTCNPTTLQEKLPILLQSPKLARVVLVLRGHEIAGLYSKVLPIVIKYRRDRAICEAVKALSRNKNHNDCFIKDWECIKSILPTLNPTKINKDKFQLLLKVSNNLPKSIKLQYIRIIHHLFATTEFDKDHEITLLTIKCILNHIKEVDGPFVKNVIEHTISQDSLLDWLCRPLSIRLVAQYPLYAFNETEQIQRFNDIVVSFLNKIKDNWPNPVKGTTDPYIFDYVECFSLILLYLDAPKNWRTLMPLIRNFYQDFNPTEKIIKLEIYMRLTNAFSQSMEQTVLEHPHLFSASKILSLDAVNILGSSFGKRLSDDIEDFVSTFCPSARYLYCDTFLNYLKYSVIRILPSEFVVHIVNELLDDIVKTNALTIGVTLYNDIIRDSQDQKDATLLEKIKNIRNVGNDEVKFYLCL